MNGNAEILSTASALMAYTPERIRPRNSPSHKDSELVFDQDRSLLDNDEMALNLSPCAEARYLFGLLCNI